MGICQVGFICWECCLLIVRDADASCEDFNVDLQVDPNPYVGLEGRLLLPWGLNPESAPF
jgi:hypothetical protein